MSRVTIRIDRLVVHGAAGIDEAALVNALRAALMEAGIANHPARREMIRVTLPPTPAGQATTLGRAAGQALAKVLAA
ncbi:hypothetical protein ABC347_03685 [Sphingomonas sp. 1P06PA]|uniref:hypothetical protein n=1 Tax=Sphingomonas sp. 1P06PA TaxID=554121 RepID=UPI0039A5DBF9